MAELTPMRQFFYDTISNSKIEWSAGALAYKWYESIGERRHSASRDAFGQNSAAYRTCRFLVKAGKITERVHTGSNGFSEIKYAALK